MRIIIDYMNALGKKYGKLVPAIGTALKEVDGAAFMATLRGDGKATLTVEGKRLFWKWMMF